MGKLTRLQWAEAERAYIVDGATQKSLATKYGIGAKSLAEYAVRHHWENKRRDYNESLVGLTPIVPPEQPKAHLGLTEAEAREQIYRAADVAVERISEHLQRNDIGAQSLKALTSALKDAKEIRDCRDGLSVEEMQAKIAKLRKEAESGTGTDMAINITVAGDTALSD